MYIHIYYWLGVKLRIFREYSAFHIGDNGVFFLFGLTIWGAEASRIFDTKNTLVTLELYGKESINFLGIPLLRNKTADGDPIYICSK